MQARVTPWVRLSVLACALAIAAPYARAQESESQESGAGKSSSGKKYTVEPFFTIVGGMAYETIQGAPGDNREDRPFTVALSRLGLRAKLGPYVQIESEFEVNSGPHGTSVWEGQAAIQVRNQMIRIGAYGLTVDVGVITDESSLDFFSMHVLDQLLMDPYTRYPLLASGFNRGVGIQARYEIIEGLSVGLNFNWANPTSTTASLVIGGTFPPFSRFWVAAHQQVGRDASQFPADQYDILVLTPSIMYRSRYVDAQAAIQFLRVDTNRSSSDDQNIDGYNVRLGAKGKLLDGSLRLFANFSVVQNETVDPDDGNKLSGELFNGMTVSGGIDYDYWKLNGVGVQYALVREQQGYGTRTSSHYINVGTTFWVHETTAIGARASFLIKCEEPDSGGCPDTSGTRSYFATVRASF